MLDMDDARRRMVDRQIVRRGIRDRRVIDAMLAVPREHFVNEDVRDDAYEDGPLSIGCGQTISQPFVVALMAEAAHLEPDDRVLEVGTGSGYAAAVLGQIARHLHTVERHAGLADTAARRLRELGTTTSKCTSETAASAGRTGHLSTRSS